MRGGKFFLLLALTADDAVDGEGERFWFLSLSLSVEVLHQTDGLGLPGSDVRDDGGVPLYLGHGVGHHVLGAGGGWRVIVSHGWRVGWRVGGQR